MKRGLKLFAVFAFSAFAWPALPAEPPTVGIVAMGPQTVFRELPTYARFYARMRELGWREGENIRYVGRGATGDLAKLDLGVQELVRSGVAVIVTVGFQEALAAKRATTAIPIVMVHPGDPLSIGAVTSLGRPGGNITGNFSAPTSLFAKRAEMLAGLVPGARRMLAAYDPPLPSGKFVEAMNDAAKLYRVSLPQAEIPAGGDYDAWVAKARRDGFEAILVAHSSSTFSPARRKALADALVKHRMPALCGTGDYVDSGCLASYSASTMEFYGSAAVYVDKILRGAKPGDLAIQQPTVYEFVINMKTAKALGISIPQVMLLRADRVVE